MLNDALANTLYQLAPAVTMLLGGCLLLCSSIVLKSVTVYSLADRRNLMGGISFVILLIAAGFHVAHGANADEVASSTALFQCDATALAAERLSLIGGLVLLLLGWSIGPRNYLAEYHGCLLIILGGIPLVGAANDLIVLFLALELISIPTYIMLAVARDENSGLEAAIKYFLLSAFSSAIFLLGVSYLYGIGGTMDLSLVQESLANQSTGHLGAMAILLVLCGLAFRITAVPFHFYAPDVFEGTSLLMAAVLSYLPKLAGVIAMIRILDHGELASTLAPILIPVLLVIAAVSMTVGNVLASVQTNLRRLLGYSSIAHTGYLLLALVAMILQAAEPSVLFTYLAAYAAMTLGVFACMAEIDEAGGKTTTMGDLSGMYYRRPAASMAMTVCLLSLIGLPFTAGFVAKLQIFIAAGGIQRWDITFVTIVMAFNAAISAGYYFRMLGKLYEQGVQLPPLRLWRPSLFLAYSVCAVLTIVWFFQPTTM